MNKGRKKKIILTITILAIVLGATIPFLFKISIIEHTLNMQLPNKVKVVEYKIAYDKLYAKIELSQSQFAEINDKFKQGISYSANTIEDPSKFFEQMKNNTFIPQKSTEIDPSELYAYTSHISGSPSADAVLVKSASGQYILFVLH